MAKHGAREMILAILLILPLAVPAEANSGRALDQTINEAAQEAARRLNDTAFDDITNVAVLPLWGDCDPNTKAYIAIAIQSQIIGGPYKVMERGTRALDTLLAEIEWDNLREDIMNQSTVQRFGRIEGCDAIIYGTVRECAVEPGGGRAVTRLTLKMGVVETGEARWSSGEVTSVRILDAAAPGGAMDPALVRAINDLCDSAVTGLKGKNVNVSRFAFFPLLGLDEGGYITEVLQAELTQAGCSPVPVSRTEWREYLLANSRTSESVEAMRDFARLNGCEAFLYGTVNEARVLEDKYKAVAGATLNLVSVETGQAIWSPGEIRGQSSLDWRDSLNQAVGDPIVWVVGGIIVLLIVWRAFAKLFKSATRPR